MGPPMRNCASELKAGTTARDYCAGVAAAVAAAAAAAGSGTAFVSCVTTRSPAFAATADVLLSNHTNFDGSKTKIPTLKTRAAGAPHPYVVGKDAVQRYLTVAEECAQAGLATTTAATR